jgi:hypothetical protein
MYHLTQSKQDISSIELGRRLGVTQTTAWKIKHKLAQVMMQRDATKRLSGRVELDDAYVGGERSGGKRGRGAPGKTPFVAAVETTPEGKPVRLKLRRVASFCSHSMASFAKRSLDPTSHEGILVKLFHHAPPRLGSKYRGQVSSKVELSSAQDLPANLTSGGTASPPRSRIRDRRAPGERHHSMRRHLRTRPDNGDAPLDPWARAAPQPRPMSGQSGRGLHDRPLRQHALGCEPPQSDQ